MALVNDLVAAFGLAGGLLAGGDPQLYGIVRLSLALSAGAVFFSTLVGLPLGALLGLGRFPGRRALIVIANAFMGMPPVVVGLFVYLLLSRSGPLGELGWLFAPEAMVLAQVVLITPILVALTRQVVEDLWAQLGEQLRSLGCGPLRAVPTLLWAKNCRTDGVEQFGERDCLRGGLGQFEAKHLMTLALANAGRLGKYGA